MKRICTQNMHIRSNHGKILNFKREGGGGGLLGFTHMGGPNFIRMGEGRGTSGVCMPMRDVLVLNSYPDPPAFSRLSLPLNV